MPLRARYAISRFPTRAPALAAAAVLAACASSARVPGPLDTAAPPALRAEVAAAVLAAPGTLGIAPGTDGAPRALLGPMVGLVTDRTARIWLQADRSGRVEAVLAAEGGATVRALGEAREEEGNVVVLEAAGLTAATRYAASFTIAGRPVSVTPPVVFRTLPPEGSPGRFRIALVSCARMAWDSVQPAWAAVAREAPDLLVWLGDNVYFERGDSAAGIAPDYASLERMAYRHAQLRALASLQPVLRTLPNVAMWDDHDYAGSDADRTFPLREGSALLFSEYWANASYGGPGVDGIWSRVRIGDVEIWLTDNRFWRDPNDAPDSPAKTMLGQTQKEWLKSTLAASDARVKIVAVGSQVLAGYHQWESYAMFAHERNELLDWIRARRIDGVVFVSGDRHLSELMRYERQDMYPLWELTASPIANRPFVTGLEIPNPIRVDGYGAGDNFGILDIDTTPGGGTITFRILDVEGDEVFAHPVPLDELAFP